MRHTDDLSLNELDNAFGQSVESILSEEEQRTAVGTTSVTDAELFFKKPRREPARVAFSRADRHAHTHIIGSTGTGKSKLLEYLIRQDLDDRRAGLTLIDPHGSLYDDVVRYLSSARPRMAERVVLFDPVRDTDYAVGFNPIPADVELSYAIPTLIRAILKAWGQDDPQTTPRINRLLDDVFTLLIASDLTIVESIPLIDPKGGKSRAQIFRYLRERLGVSIDEFVEDNWAAFDEAPLRERRHDMEGVTNRLRAFIRSERIRNIIGQTQRCIDFRRVMDEGKILLINLHGADRLSVDDQKLLGTMMVNEMYRAAMLRDPHDPKLKRHTLYIDEFARFVSHDIARGLEECRKFKLFFTLSHQHLAQLKREDEYLYYSVLTNCKNKIVFGGLMYEDAEIMAREMVTGHLDLKAIKLAMERLAHRYELETYYTTAEGYAESRGTGEAQSLTESAGTAVMDGTSTSVSQSKTKSRGQNLGWGTTESEGNALAEGEQQSVTESKGKSRGQALSILQSRMRGWMESRGNTTTVGESFGESVSVTDGDSSSVTHSKTHGRGKGITRTNSVSAGLTETHGQSVGRSSSRSLNYYVKNLEVHLPSEEEAVQALLEMDEGEADRVASARKALTELARRRDGENGKGAASLPPLDENSVAGVIGQIGAPPQDREQPDIEEQLGEYSRAAIRDMQAQMRSVRMDLSNSATLSEGYHHSHNSSIGRNWQHGQAESISQNSFESSGEALQQGKNHSVTHGLSHTVHHSQSQTLTQGTSGSVTEGENRTENTSESEGRAVQNGTSRVRSTMKQSGKSTAAGVHTSESESQQTGQGSSHSVTRSQSLALAQTSSSQRGETQSLTVNEQTRYKPVPFMETASVNFWSRQELEYLALAAMKVQDTAHAFVKIGNDRVYAVRIDEVKSTPYDKRRTPLRIAQFRQRVIDKNADLYTPVGEIQREIEERQRQVFGSPIRFGARLVAELPAAQEVGQPVIDIAPDQSEEQGSDEGDGKLFGF